MGGTGIQAVPWLVLKGSPTGAATRTKFRSWRGRIVRKRFPTLKLAEPALARAQVAALDSTYIFRGDLKTTLAEHAQTWLASLRVEHSTLVGYQTYLKCQVLPRIRGRAMSSRRRSDMSAFVRMLVNKGLAPEPSATLRAARHDAVLGRLRPLITAAPLEPATRGSSRRLRGAFAWSTLLGEHGGRCRWHTKEPIVLVLGATADDKGAQLETLVCRVLEEQGYAAVRPNVIGPGGNEVDVAAERRADIVRDTHVTPLMCEAKAYAGPVNMPTWQRFLGKLLIARAADPTTVGLLIALNGVNGNVAGSLAALRRGDTSLFVVEGTDLIRHAINQRELSDTDAVRVAVEGAYRRAPIRLEAAYYGGAFHWVASWNDEEYSIVNGHGAMLPAEDVERMRPALEATLTGALLATAEARAEAEARHFARLAVTNMLFRGEQVRFDDGNQTEAVAALAEEPFTRVIDGRLELASPGELDATAVARLFLSLFDNAVKVPLLSFMIDGHHHAFVERLVEVLPDLQRGFSLDSEELDTLRALAIPFPSVWAVLATEIPMITTHRTNSRVVDEATLAADRTALWEAVFEAVRSDYTEPRLRGFLYDYLNIAELEEHEELAVKTKSGPLAQPVRIEKRTAVRQYADDSIPEGLGPVYVLVRLLPSVSEPWDDGHPEPEFPLGDF